MSKLILAVATSVLLAGTSIIWSKNFGRVKPELALTLTQAEAKEELMMLSPFDIMIKQGKTPAEEWRYAF
jgi:hypothetical protein